MNTNEFINALATTLVEKSPLHLRIAFNEDDNSTAPEPECAHFLKFDERRMGRDLELYGFMAKLDGDNIQNAAVMMLEELVLPLHSGAPEAFKSGIAFLREQGAVFGDKQGEWNELLNSCSNNGT